MPCPWWTPLLLLSLCVPAVVTQVTVTLLDTAIFVQEGEQFQLRVQRIGAITSSVYVILKASITYYEYNKLLVLVQHVFSELVTINMLYFKCRWTWFSIHLSVMATSISSIWKHSPANVFVGGGLLMYQPLSNCLSVVNFLGYSTKKDV